MFSISLFFCKSLKCKPHVISHLFLPCNTTSQFSMLPLLWYISLVIFPFKLSILHHKLCMYLLDTSTHMDISVRASSIPRNYIPGVWRKLHIFKITLKLLKPYSSFIYKTSLKFTLSKYVTFPVLKITWLHFHLTLGNFKMEFFNPTHLAHSYLTYWLWRTSCLLHFSHPPKPIATFLSLSKPRLFFLWNIQDSHSSTWPQLLYFHFPPSVFPACVFSS